MEHKVDVDITQVLDSDDVVLSAVERRLWTELDKIDSRLATIYQGALVAMANTKNPDRYRHAAASLRQIVDMLPDVDPRIPFNKDEIVMGLKATVNTFTTTLKSIGANKILCISAVVGLEPCWVSGSPSP
jgi:hypothetical protein